MELQDIVDDLAFALKQVDSTRPVEKKYKPGIGPHGEDNARDLAINYLQGLENKKEIYKDVGPQKYPETGQQCDFVIPSQWAIELKLMRPFGNNDKEVEQWSNKIIHPYYGNKSSVGDALKLSESAFKERKAVVLFAYEHQEPILDKEPTLKTFELILTNVLGLDIGDRVTATVNNLVHPTHNVLHVIGWEIE